MMKRTLVVLLLSPFGVAGDGTCGLYLAPSSVKNGGLGVFAGKAFQYGAKIDGLQGLGVQVLDPERIPFEQEWMMESFLWNPGTVGGQSEAKNVSTFLTGIASLANTDPWHRNVFQDGLVLDDPFDRYTDAMAGSTTPYHGHVFRAFTDIEPGAELFVGSTGYKHDKAEAEYFHKAGRPSMEDYRLMDKIIRGLVEYKAKHPRLSEGKWIDLWYRLRNEMIQDNPYLRELIPDSFLEFEKLLQPGGLQSFVPKPRDTTWLAENGWCLDNIMEGPSKITEAGRGAFATRSMKTGSIVSVAPLLQVHDSTNLRLNMPDNSTEQLLLNYCFGHRRSKLLLCPTTNANLINHSTEPNVAIRWAKQPNQNEQTDDSRDESFNHHRFGSLDELLMQDKQQGGNARLIFEFVAIRDIEAGEEIYMDYGPEWENALREHYRTWSPPSTGGYIPANTATDVTDLNGHYSFECALEPYATEHTTDVHADPEDYDANPMANRDNWLEQAATFYVDNDFLCWYPCRPLSTDPIDHTYHVEVFAKFAETNQKIRKIGNLPNHAIRPVEREYGSNQHLPQAFRHYVPIPDDMFPTRWRADYVSARSLHLGAFEEETADELEERWKQYEQLLREAPCGIYLAPSNIPNAGFGMYTAVPMDGPALVVGTTSSIIHFDRPDDLGNYAMSDYVWSSESYGSEYEGGKETTATIAAVDMGSLCNSHSGLINLEAQHPRFDPLLDRCKDPGAGAFSDYVHFAFRSNHSINAGEELFISYGNTWFQDRTRFNTVPLAENFREVNELLSSLWGFATLEGTELGGNEVEDLLSFFAKNLVTDERSKSALGGVGTVADLQNVLQRNGTAQATVEPRTEEWFQEHGQCFDHLFISESRIPQAGKGAFTRRHIKKGDIIISSPLVATFGAKKLEYPLKHNKTAVNTKALFLNYQFSHPDSSVYFFPLSHAAMINHGSNRGGPFQSPNAAIRWSSMSNKGAYFLYRPLSALEEESYSVMVLDFVALQDIGVEEEILIDYSEEWEEAWLDHVKNFKSPCLADGLGGDVLYSSKATKEMNSDKFNPTYHTWSDDHLTVCRFGESSTWLRLLGPNEVSRDGSTVDSPFNGITIEDEGFEISRASSSRQPCRILSSDPTNETFEVVGMWTNHNGGQSAPFVKYHHGLHADDVIFLNKPERSDTYWPGAFRHPIKIPDGIFPEHWKDLKGNN